MDGQDEVGSDDLRALLGEPDGAVVSLSEDELREMLRTGEVHVGCLECDYVATSAEAGSMSRDFLRHMVEGHGMSDDEALQAQARLKVSMWNCARCGTRYGTEREAKAARSRTDNASGVCSGCGTDEALMQLAGRPLQPPDEWPVKPIGRPARMPEAAKAAAGWRTPGWDEERSNRAIRPQPVPTPKELPDLRLHLLERWIPDGLFDRYADAIVGGNARNEGEWERRTLRAASLWWIKDEMVDLVAAAAPTIPEDVTAAELDLPADQACGLAVLGKTWVGSDAEAEGDPCQVDAVMWGPSKVAGVPCLTMSFYRFMDFAGGLGPRELELAASTGAITSARKERIGVTDNGDPTFRLSGGAWAWIGRTDWPLTASLTDFTAIPAHPRDSDNRRDSMIEDRRWFAALCALVNHRLAEQEPVYAARQARRRAERAGVDKKAAASLVRLIRLRQARHVHPDTGEETEAKRIDWSHRWMVGSHMAWRRCGPRKEQRRLVWIAPFVKGPADKPLVIKENVRVWVK